MNIGRAARPTLAGVMAGIVLIALALTIAQTFHISPQERALLALFIACLQGAAVSILIWIGGLHRR